MGIYRSLAFILLPFVILCQLSFTVNGECPSSHFQCENKNCIQLTWRCDEDDDCGDNSDEQKCVPKTCASTDFRCTNGKCISQRWQCDRDTDCHDGSDENPEHCNLKLCNENEFTCNNKVCIPKQWMCDLEKDCTDGSDELNCDHHCQENEFPCKNGQCISKLWTCDQEDDCGDKTDEENCPIVNCSAGQFMCADRKSCIPQRWACDGDNDCRDASDEVNCTSPRISLCAANEFQCKDSSGECIHMNWQCDGDRDCSDGSDEPPGCLVTCRPTDFFCKESKYCINGMYECNGKHECLDGTDELGCNVTRKCPEDEFDCNGEGIACIPKERMCDGVNDCGNFEDEFTADPKACHDANPCTTAPCAHTCINLHKKFKCECYHGFELEEDQRTCADIDECLIPGSCSQTCENKKGHYTCSCQDGYVLEGGRYCKAVVRPSLIFTNEKDVRKILIDRRTYLTVVENTMSAVALDYNYVSGHVYWSDVKLEKIQRASIHNGSSSVETVVHEDLAVPDGLAIDWIHDLLYWTDTGKDTIEVMDLSTKKRKVLFDQNLAEPRAIVLDPIEGWMYWTDWGDSPKIEKSGMNGGHRTSILNSSGDLQWPNGLALDHVDRRLYWNDAKLHLIATIKLDGSDMRIVRTDPALIRHPFALTVFEDSVYWTDWGTESIQKVNKFDGRDEVIALDLKSPMDIRIYHPHGQPAGENRCGDDNGGCSHICLPAPYISKSSARYTCVCENGYMWDEHDSRLCVKNVEIISNTTVEGNSTAVTVNVTTSIVSDDNVAVVSNSTSPLNKLAPDENSTKNPKVALQPDVTAVYSPELTNTLQPVDNSNGTDEKSNPINKSSEAKTGLHVALIAGISTLCIVGMIVVIGFFVLKHYRKQSKKTMNFDNPVYRNTTEDQLVIKRGSTSSVASLPSNMQPLTAEDEYA